jgi:osmotically-inducible protein OsmY
MRSDTEVRLDILDELLWEPTVDANGIGVTVHNGIVTLTGYVSTYSEKRASEQAAARINGVKAIAEEIEVKLPASHQHGDTDIAQAVVNALKWNSRIKDEIGVKVEDGVVTLTSDVHWKYERDFAKRAVENLAGVRGIVNLISVQAKPSVRNVKKQIKKAFERAAILDAAELQVEAHNGEVTLKGNVHSITELREAEYAAWAGPGVTKVTNQLKVI